MKVQEPHNGYYNQWEVQTNEEALEYVHDLDLFVTVQLLDETPEVLSLGKLCEEHGYSHEWVSGQKPRLTKQGKNICKTDTFVRIVVPGLSSSSRISSSSTSTSQDLSSSGPVAERRDDPASGNCTSQTQKTQNK